MKMERLSYANGNNWGLRLRGWNYYKYANLGFLF